MAVYNASVTDGTTWVVATTDWNANRTKRMVVKDGDITIAGRNYPAIVWHDAARCAFTMPIIIWEWLDSVGNPLLFDKLMVKPGQICLYFVMKFFWRMDLDFAKQTMLQEGPNAHDSAYHVKHWQAPGHFDEQTMVRCMARLATLHKFLQDNHPIRWYNLSDQEQSRLVEEMPPDEITALWPKAMESSMDDGVIEAELS